jgi:hypothetical protein
MKEPNATSPKRASRQQHYEKRAMPSDTATLARIQAYSTLAIYPYHRNPGLLPSGWHCDASIMRSLVQDLQATFPGKYDSCEDAIVDIRTGLTAVLFVHPVDRVYVLAFGGTTSGKAVSESSWLRFRRSNTSGILLRQSLANASAALGRAPGSYRQASALADALVTRMAKDPAHAGFALRLTGHSKGGGEAMYAALRGDTPIPATVFAPAHLTTGLIANLCPESVAKARDLIESYSAYGDPVPALRHLVPGMHGLGLAHHFRGMPGKGPIHLHAHTDLHLAHYAGPSRDVTEATAPDGHGCRDVPADVRSTLARRLKRYAKSVFGDWGPTARTGFPARPKDLKLQSRCHRPTVPRGKEQSNDLCIQNG